MAVVASNDAASQRCSARLQGFFMRQVLGLSIAFVLLVANGGCGGEGGSSLSAGGNVAAAATVTGRDDAGTPTGAAIQATSLSHVFSPRSFWYQPIPANAPLNPKSSIYTQDLLEQIKNHYGTVNLNTTSFASPIYYVRTSGGSDAVTWVDGTPIYPVRKRVNVKFWDCQNKGRTPHELVEQWRGVPIPAGATPANGSDSEMSIYDLSTHTLWEFWVTRRVGGEWQACWGGRVRDTMQNPGIFPHPYGATATGLPFIGGEISAEELARGQINHVIGIALVNAASWKEFSWPASRSDGYNPNDVPDRIPEGIRLRLDPSVDVDALNLTPVGRIIAKAAQKYGFVVWDKAGAVSLRMVNPASYELAGLPNPYPALFDNIASYDVLKGFPWDKMQFMPMNYGKP